MNNKISACITAFNEENNIRRCLESVKWADEIVVLDSFSTDRTVEISKEYTDMVFQHKWMGYIGQKNLIKDIAVGAWILFIDADEEISVDLREEIKLEFKTGRCDHYAGYEFPRMVWYLERWILHGDWYPDVKLRLFRKGQGLCGGKEPHDRVIVDGTLKRLNGNMYHYSYSNINDQLITINRFSSITSEGQYINNKSFLLIDLIFRPFFRFIRGYFLKCGFMDGLPGLIIAANTSFGVFIKYAKLWELNLKNKQGNNETSNRDSV